MYTADLQGFLAKLEEDGDLVKVVAVIDPYLEAAAIIDRVCKGASGCRALLFETLKGSQLPVAANLFGSQRRMAAALGVDTIERLAERLRSDLLPLRGMNSARALAQLTAFSRNIAATQAKAPAFTEERTDEGLESIPALHSWVGDGGRYLTLGQTFTRHPETEVQNCGMYRVQIVDRRSAVVRFHAGSGGGAHLADWHARDEAMPVAIVLGGPPALTWCAGVSLPADVSEVAFIRYLCGLEIAETRCPATGLLVPSTAEIVIEGFIAPGEVLEEGPFGNHTGYYAPAGAAPVLRVTALHMREKAVYPCTLVGPPPMENRFMAQAAMRILLPLLQHDCPWVVDVEMPQQSLYHRVALVAVDDQKRAASELGAELQQSLLLRNARCIVLLDRGCDLLAAEEVYWKTVNAGVWSDTVQIDGSKMLIDARASKRERLSPDLETLEKMSVRWPSLGL